MRSRIRNLRVDRQQAIRAAALAGLALLGISTLPGLLKTPAPPPVPADVGFRPAEMARYAAGPGPDEPARTRQKTARPGELRKARHRRQADRRMRERKRKAARKRQSAKKRDRPEEAKKPGRKPEVRRGRGSGGTGSPRPANGNPSTSSVPAPAPVAPTPAPAPAARAPAYVPAPAPSASPSPRPAPADGSQEFAPR